MDSKGHSADTLHVERSRHLGTPVHLPYGSLGLKVELYLFYYLNNVQLISYKVEFIILMVNEIRQKVKQDMKDKRVLPVFLCVDHALI